MSKATEFQTNASECLSWAKSADTDEKRNQFLDLARIWIKAATTEAGGHDGAGVVAALEPLGWKAR
jgi:hypothetical protein